MLRKPLEIFSDVCLLLYIIAKDAQSVWGKIKENLESA